MKHLFSLETWQRLRSNLSLQFGLIGLIFVVAVAYLGPVLLHQDPLKVDFDQTLLAPSAAHWFGTDDLGRDVFARVVTATAVDLQISIVCVVLPFMIGSVVGLLSGYIGGWVDTVLMRIVDIVWAFPFYVLIIAIVGALGPSIGNMYLAFTMVVWISFARIVRSEVLLLKNADYIQAAKVLGYSHTRIVLRHLLPNVITPAIIFMMGDVVLTILAVTSLGFLGLGIQPPTPEWGIMISEGRDYIFDGWWISVFPGIAIAVIGIVFTLIGDGLDNFLRPKS